MIQKLRGTIAIAAVILIATGPVVTQVWFQAANAQVPQGARPPPGCIGCNALYSK